VLGGDGSGSISGVIQGVEYVVANAAPGDVINLSLGGGQSPGLDAAVAAAANAGILIAIAAGNDGINARNSSPAGVNAPNVYTVSAIDSSDSFADFSNFGNPPVDFAAPGVAILSTYLQFGYAELSGTSMAAPHMAGVLLQLGANQEPGFRGRARDDKDEIPDRIVYLRGFGDDGGDGEEETPQNDSTDLAAADPTNRN
jgi:subtilisin family serine protease